jgi:hypothetical protein
MKSAWNAHSQGMMTSGMIGMNRHGQASYILPGREHDGKEIFAAGRSDGNRCGLFLQGKYLPVATEYAGCIFILRGGHD